MNTTSIEYTEEALIYVERAKHARTEEKSWLASVAATYASLAVVTRMAEDAGELELRGDRAA